jgi:hypothetical protein
LSDPLYLYVTVLKCAESNVSVTDIQCVLPYFSNSLINVGSPSGSFCRLYKTRYSIFFSETVQATTGTSHSLTAPRLWSNSVWDMSNGPLALCSGAVTYLAVSWCKLSHIRGNTSTAAAGKHNGRHHDNPAHRPRNHTLYDKPLIRIVFHVTQKDRRSSLMMAGYCRNM